jgi:hypothetical protein
MMCGFGSRIDDYGIGLLVLMRVARWSPNESKL